ncbi:MAG: GGDEF domain-containing protein, partial [Anaeroplasmataceae bacterium]|nr:GGDEF domain-containing protein [Anaeroplasmataceae bacterium]
MEKNLAESTEELELIKSRFMTILDKTKEGIFFTDLKNKSIWINNVLLQDLCLTENMLDLKDFHKHIHPDDFAMYKTKLAQVNNINPNYSAVYRFNVGSRYAYIREEGSRISDGHNIELCGLIRILDNYHYERTETELDQLQGEPELLTALNNLYRKGKTFEVVRIKVGSIPNMNEQYGRSVGNIALSEYIKLIRSRYVDADMIYRISGLEFVALITEYHKMEKLKSNLNNKEKILHIPTDYGNAHTKIDAYMGICYCTDAANAKDALEKTKECLKYSTNPQYNSNFAYYKDIR